MNINPIWKVRYAMIHQIFHNLEDIMDGIKLGNLIVEEENTGRLMCWIHGEFIDSEHNVVSPEHRVKVWLPEKPDIYRATREEKKKINQLAARIRYQSTVLVDRLLEDLGLTAEDMQPVHEMYQAQCDNTPLVQNAAAPWAAVKAVRYQQSAPIEKWIHEILEEKHPMSDRARRWAWVLDENEVIQPINQLQWHVSGWQIAKHTSKFIATLCAQGYFKDEGGEGRMTWCVFSGPNMGYWDFIDGKIRRLLLHCGGGVDMNRNPKVKMWWRVSVPLSL